MSDSQATSRTFSRTHFLKATGGGMLLLSFGLPTVTNAAAAVSDTGPWPDADPRKLDTWIAVHPDNTVTVFHGKTDLGQGLETAFRQIVAEEMDLTFKQVKSIVGDTAQSPHQGGASGSTGVTGGGPAVRNMAAEARRVLVETASKQLGVPVSQLTVREGVVSSSSGAKVTYGELLGGKLFNTTVQSNMQFGNGLTAVGIARPKNPATHHIIGSSVPRIDIPDKVFGRYNFNVDARLPNMRHARVIRPPEAGMTVGKINGFKQKVEGIVKVMPMGVHFVAVVAEREEQAIAAARTLDVTWNKPATPPFSTTAGFFDWLRAQKPRNSTTPTNTGNVDAAMASAAKTIQAEYLWPLQSHAGMAPGGGLANYDEKTGTLTLWSGSQKPHQVQNGIADLLKMPKDKVRVIWQMGPGSYGRGDADDANLEAAWIARQVGGAVRLQWMRHEGIAWDPKGPATIINVRGGLDSTGKVTVYDYFWKGVSGQEVGTSGDAAADTLVGMSLGFVRPQRNTSGTPADRYVFANRRNRAEIVEHFLPMSNPLRSSHMRDPQGPQAAFASEQFMDELAYAAGADPIEFRIKHLAANSRDVDVLKAAAARWNWDPRPAASKVNKSADVLTGRGIAYQFRGEHIGAIITELEVTRKTGKIQLKRVLMATDVGQVLNPDGLRNTMEGNYIQAASRTLKEEVRFTPKAVTSIDWVTYPIINAKEVPERIEVVMVNNAPGNPPGPAGEGMTRVTPPSIANAFFDATGVRLRQAPFTPARVRAALAAAGM
jgi:CO/xanthine dehydrogenase Mo-binding subunit